MQLTSGAVCIALLFVHFCFCAFAFPPGEVYFKPSQLVAQTVALDLLFQVNVIKTIFSQHSCFCGGKSGNFAHCVKYIIF